MKKYLALLFTCLSLTLSAKNTVIEPIKGITVSSTDGKSKTVCIKETYSQTFPPGKIKVGKKGPFVLYAKQEKGENQLAIYLINHKLAPSEMVKSYIQTAKKVGKNRYEIYRNETYLIVLFVSIQVEDSEAKNFFKSFNHKKD